MASKKIPGTGIAPWTVWVFLALAAPAVAQLEQARITGTVRDSSGAVIPRARITMLHEETNVEHAAETNELGTYLSVPLRVGAYRVSASADGFKRAVRGGVMLRIQETVLVDFTLEVGALTESVEVTAAPPLLETTDVSQGQVIDNKKVVDLPLNGRDFLALAGLSSGAFPVVGQKGSTGFSANGLRTELNNYMLDGLDNNMHQQAYTGGQAQAVEPSVDAIQEFKVQTSAYSAEFGNNMGAVVNVTLKSGTNHLRGTLFEFVRNDKFDAKNFFDSPDAPIPPYKQNQFGGTVGGPILRNKTFFFGDYEGRRQHTSGTVLSTVPTELERTGDFSQSYKGAARVVIYDPATYNKANNTRQPFANNVIPAARLDLVGRAAAGLYPLPNRSGTVNNFLYNPVNPLSEDKFDVRVDHNFSASDMVFVRVSYQWSDWLQSLQMPAPAFGGSAAALENASRSYALNHTHIFTPALFNTLRLGYNQLLTNRISPVDVNYNQQIGLKGLPFQLAGLASFSVSGFRSLGTMTGNPNRTDSQVRQLRDDLSWMRGRHNLKFGASLTWPQSPQIHYYQANGVFTMNGNFTRQTSNNRDGFSMADLLLGLPYQSQLSSRASSALRRRLYHAYVQDEFKATDRLTLSLGLRYEFTGPWVDKYNHLANFDIDTDRAHPRLVLAKSGSLADRSTLKVDYLNFAPRFGFACRVGGRTVVRSGYGIYYGGVEHIGDRYLHAGPPFFFQSSFFTDSITPSIVLRDGYPPGATTANVTNLQTISQDRNNLTAYSQQWNFTVERQLPWSLVVDVSYIGSRGIHLLRRIDTNAPPPGPGDINSRRPATRLEVPGLPYVVTPLADTFRREWSGNSTYHGFQMKFEKRLSAGVSFLGAYMWSKAIDDLIDNPPNPYNVRLERGLSDNHFPQRFVFSFNYDVPVGRGRRFLAAAPRLADWVLGGWAAAGITTLSAGNRVNSSVQGNPSNTGQADRPDLLRDPRLPRSQRTLARWFDTDAFVRQANYTFGNAPRNAIEAPGVVNFDLALYKLFRLAERAEFQFRAEAFNAFNTPHFGNPGSQLGTSAFGVISSADDSRTMQFGLKLRW
jgi:hypothetical protein